MTRLLRHLLRLSIALLVPLHHTINDSPLIHTPSTLRQFVPRTLTKTKTRPARSDPRASLIHSVPSGHPLPTIRLRLPTNEWEAGIFVLRRRRTGVSKEQEDLIQGMCTIHISSSTSNDPIPISHFLSRRLVIRARVPLGCYFPVLGLDRAARHIVFLFSECVQLSCVEGARGVGVG